MKVSINTFTVAEANVFITLDYAALDLLYGPPVKILCSSAGGGHNPAREGFIFSFTKAYLI